MKFYFCPRCKIRIIPPDWIMSGMVKAEKGINLKCGNPLCGKGQVIIKLENKTNEKN